jgi:hypothetical protein
MSKYTCECDRIENENKKLKRIIKKLKKRAENYCGNERPARKVLCQLKKGHKDSHRAIIFWEDEHVQ